MSQQINLLPKSKSRHSPAFVALLILGFVALAIFATWGVKRSMLAGARADEAASAVQLKELTAQLDQRIRVRAAELNAEIAALKPRAEAAEQVLTLSATVGKTDGYAVYFSALAAVREDGLWLTDVVVDKAGKSLQLGGLSLDKDAVLRYTQRLNAALAASGIKLTTLEMTPQPMSSASTASKGSSSTVIKFILR